MQPWQLALYGFVAFGMSILSGIAGAGGGFVLTPLMILLGLSPAQAVSSGKFNGIALTIGSLSGFRKYHTNNVSRRRILAIMALALVIGLITPFVIKTLENKWYELILGVIILSMIPLMILKHVGTASYMPTRRRTVLGGLLLTVSLFLQGAFSGGLGTLVNVVLMGMLGMSANEAQITKRWSQLILNSTIIFGVVGAGLIIWPIAVTGIIAALIGGTIGARIAVRKGDAFALHVLILLMAVSGVALIASAL